jgi:hypothetical protein
VGDVALVGLDEAGHVLALEALDDGLLGVLVAGLPVAFGGLPGLGSGRGGRRGGRGVGLGEQRAPVGEVEVGAGDGVAVAEAGGAF